MGFLKFENKRPGACDECKQEPIKKEKEWDKKIQEYVVVVLDIHTK